MMPLASHAPRTPAGVRGAVNGGTVPVAHRKNTERNEAKRTRVAVDP